jgi:putative oxidoreductase
VLLVLGLLTPFAAAGLLASKAVAVVVALVPALSVPLFASDGVNSLELDLLLGAGAAALVFAGAGRIALDAGRTYQRRPLPWSVLSLLVAVAVALLVLFVLRR